MTTNTVLDSLSTLLPYNTDRQYILCKSKECLVYYPVKTITENEEVQYEYMNEMKELYQTTLDEVQQ
jgi:hypothetical protein